MPHRIPTSLSLDFDRKAAKALLQSCQHGDAAALERVLRHHPRFRSAPRGALKDAALQLSDAHLVVAREYGFASWPRWKHFVETLQLDAAGRAAALVRAACSDGVAHAQTLLQHQPVLARHDFFSACACGEEDLVRQQLESSPELANRRGGPLAWLPLQYACHSRLLRSDPARAGRIVAAARMLLERGAKPNLFHTPEWQGVLSENTPLFGAAGIANHAGLTQLLLDVGADPDESCAAPDPQNPRSAPWGTEALYHASEFREVECLHLLLKAKPHPVRVSYCLGRNLDFDNPEGVKLYLEHGADPNFRIPWAADSTHLHKAVRNGRSRETIEALLAHGADINARNAKGLSPYRLALRFGYAELAAFLKAKGAATDVTSEDLALVAAWRGEAASSAVKVPPELLGRAINRGDTTALKHLLDAGADANSSDSGEPGVPPLHWACWRGKLEPARLLLEAGAEHQRLNSYGGNALSTTIHGSANCFDSEGGPAMKPPAEALRGEYVEILELLLARGAQLPRQIEEGSEAVKEFLRSKGVPDAGGA